MKAATSGGSPGVISRMAENPWLQVVAVSSLAVAYTIIGVYFTLMINLRDQAAGFFTGSKLVIVLAQGATAADGAAVAHRAMAFQRVAGALYVPKEQALMRFADSLGNRRGLLAGLDENPLPDTVEVLLYPDEQGEVDLVKRLSALPGVQEVLTSRPWLRMLEQARRSLISLAAALGLLLFTAVTMLAANVVRLTYYARRSEMEIMALVGATPGFLRRPLLAESLLQGLLAAALAYGLVWGLLRLLAAPGALPFGMDLQSLLTPPPLLAPLLAVVALLSTLAGSFLGVGRALRGLHL